MTTRLLLVVFTALEAEQGAGFAAQLGAPFDILNFGEPAPTDLGAEKVFQFDVAELPPADALARSIETAGQDYSHIAAVSSMRSTDVMARAAGLMDAAMVTDAVEVVSATKFKRPIVAGSIIATVEALSMPVVIIFRPAGFPATARGGCSATESIALDTASRVKVVRRSVHGGARPDLTQAKVIVSGGRPLRDHATFEEIIGGLADDLGGAVGATRAAVDSGIAPNECQVGQTGKIVAPDLYIAAGISGSTQHMAGIKDSKLIVAINKDPDAPIFEVADYGLVADLFGAIPEMRRLLAR